VTLSRLQGGSADSTYHLELLRRREEQTRRWLGNNKLIQAWDYTPRTRLKTGTRVSHGYTFVAKMAN
jgi:hypothetical protein